MALATVERLTFSYSGAERPALDDISLELGPGEVVALLGPSGSGKSTLLRALAGLVPHFHGGRYAGRVSVLGRDTRHERPAELCGAVASVFQDPEDQIVMALVANEVAFGLENVGAPIAQIWPRVERALARVGATHLQGRRTAELSGGELQRVCLASALALEPELLLLDEPTSQLDADAASAFLALAREHGSTVVFSEQRIGRSLAVADRVLFMSEGRLLLDASLAEAEPWLREHRPQYSYDHVYHLDNSLAGESDGTRSPAIATLRQVSFSYGGGPEVLGGADLEVHRGEIVALEGPNGSGKTTLAKIAAGLLTPSVGLVSISGRAAYLSQDPGRYLVKETAIDEVALAVGGDHARAREVLERVSLSWAAERHARDLSSGERQRLALAAVAVAEPDLLVLDEPTRGLDPDRKAELAAWLTTEAAAGRAVLVATHDGGLPAHRRVALGAAAEVAVAV